MPNERCDVELPVTGEFVAFAHFGAAPKEFYLNHDMERITIIDAPGKVNPRSSQDGEEDDEENVTEEDVQFAMSIFASSKVRVLKEDLIDQDDNIMIDIPANFQLGAGLRKHVSRLHGDYDPLDNYFSKKLVPGDIIVIEPPKEGGCYAYTIFYLICRVKLHDEFDMDAYKSALDKVRVEVDCREIDSCSTARVPFRRSEHGFAIRDAMNEAFEGSRMIIHLCVGYPSH